MAKNQIFNHYLTHKNDYFCTFWSCLKNEDIWSSHTSFFLKASLSLLIGLPMMTQSHEIASSQYLVLRLEWMEPNPEGSDTKIWQPEKEFKIDINARINWQITCSLILNDLISYLIWKSNAFLHQDISFPSCTDCQHFFAKFGLALKTIIPQVSPLNLLH